MKLDNLTTVQVWLPEGMSEDRWVNRIQTRFSESPDECSLLIFHKNGSCDGEMEAVRFVQLDQAESIVELNPISMRENQGASLVRAHECNKVIVSHLLSEELQNEEARS